MSPIICKEIKCKEDVIINIDRTRQNDRLNKMRESFKWDDSFEEEEKKNERMDWSRP